MSPVPDFSEITENARIDSIVTPTATAPPTYRLRLANPFSFRLQSFSLKQLKASVGVGFSIVIPVAFVQDAGGKEDVTAMKSIVEKILRKRGITTGKVLMHTPCDPPLGVITTKQYYQMWVRVS